MRKVYLSVLVTALVFIASHYGFGQSITTSTITGSSFCPGAAVSVPFTINPSPFNSGNVFTAQLSDATGSFASPTNIGTLTSTTASPIAATIPTTIASGTGYRIRVISSNPAIVGTDNASNLTINAITLNAPSIPLTTFCQGQSFTITYTVGSCNFFNTPTTNKFTAELSDASGSFASPTNIGTVNAVGSGTITATIPAGTPAGTGYRIRITSTNPARTSADNGTDLIVSAPAGNPAVFGSNVWNVYAYAGTAFTSYYGFYTENNTSFNSTTRWANNTSPSNANASSGNAYQGCVITNSSTFSFIYKRTGFTCGYYQLDVPAHDDNVTILIDGTQIFQHIGCCDAHTNVWTGFLGPSSSIEARVQNNGGGNSFLSLTFSAAANPLTVSPSTTVCVNNGSTLTASSALSLNYSWSPATYLNTTTGATVISTPTATGTTAYTVTGADPTTGCTVTGSVSVTGVSASTTPTITLTATPSATLCSGITTTTLTASGANTYTWSPATGLSATTGTTVVANPSSTTTYTVTGNTGCKTATKTQTVTVENVPGAPSPTTYGNNVWNAYVYSGTAFNNFYGFYTENNLNFNTTSRWNNNNGPSVANNASGSAYTGCTVGGTNYSVSFKRTNFTCGYYQIDIPYHDDYVTLLVDGLQVFQHNGCCDAHTNTWSGFLNASSRVEVQLINFSGPGSLQISFSPSSPLTLSPPVTICAGTNTGLTSTSSVSGGSFAWSFTPSEPTITLSNPNAANSFVQTTAATPAGNYTFTSTFTDATTGCSATKTVVVTVDPLPNTIVTPSSVTTSCPSAGITLTASGANTYIWNPSTGLNTTSGYQVIATPNVTTDYTVTGSNNCSSNSAIAHIQVNPPASPTIYPTGTWNVYGFNSTTVGTNYVGFYTENGSGTSGYDFNTTTRWASGGAPSTANATNGNAWVGCTMNATNVSMSFKRTGFACGVYQIDVPAHDDNYYLYINGSLVASHVGCCDAHTNVWTGVLSSNSQVEFQLVQGGGASFLSVQFTPISQPATQSTWIGGTSNDWFTASNWCGGGGVPTSTIDVLIPSNGALFMPTISSTGATCRNITISSGTSLTLSGGNGLSVNGNWLNNGTFNGGTGTITFAGSGSGNTITSSTTETFYNLTVNKTNGITISSGIQQVSNLLTLTSGVVTQNAALEILAAASVSGASNSSYVDGTVKKVGNSAFTFPVGKGGLYRPIAISAPSNATDHFTAQYFNTTPQGSYPNSSRDNTLDHISAAEYWILNRTGGSANVNVTLSWNTNSGGVTTLSELRVARWDISQAKWKDQGNGGTTGNTTSGTVITSAPVTSFSPFTLASAGGGNPLPVHLKSFNCSLTPQGHVVLDWATVTESNSDYFEVERSADGKNFKSAGKKDAAGNSSKEIKYRLEDKAPLYGQSYYRLKEVDYDGKTSYTELCAVFNPILPENSAYPNPAGDVVYINLSEEDQIGWVKIQNSIGVECKVPVTVDTDKITINSSGLASGVYIIDVVVNQKLRRMKVAIQH
jgi:hypothetical protein